MSHKSVATNPITPPHKIQVERDDGLHFPPLDTLSQAAQDNLNEYLAGMSARGFGPLQETVDAIIERHRVAELETTSVINCSN